MAVAVVYSMVEASRVVMVVVLCLQLVEVAMTVGVEASTMQIAVVVVGS
jgi:hypothetical protein